MPIWKIASSEVENYQLLREMAKTHKKIILSTNIAPFLISHFAIMLFRAAILFFSSDLLGVFIPIVYIYN